MTPVDSSALRSFLDAHFSVVRPLSKRAALAWWDFATTGSEAAAKERKAAEVAVRRVYANEADFLRVREMLSERDPGRSGAPGDPLLRRQLFLVYLSYLEGQRDEHTLEEIARRETALEGLFHNFRAPLGGREVGDNEIRRILKEETDGELRREAWEASKRIGEEAAPRILELVELRNGMAQKLGFDDYFQFALGVSEIDLGRLLALLDDLVETTEAPFRREKEALDERLARRFRIEASELAPWHYSDPFFQEAPADGAIDTDAPYRGQDLSALTRRFYDGLGMEIADLLARSDLEPRPGKCQHAFCLSIDHGPDVRVLSNNEPDAYWAGTMLHEFGHAVYDKYVDPGLPYALRTPAHALTTEAVAMLLGRHDLDPTFLTDVVGLDRSAVREMAGALKEKQRLSSLVFIRWAIVVVRFERELYGNPTGDLDRLWWHLVEDLQLIRPPAGRARPDWAAKIHIATSPVYYHNYILGELTAAQLDEAARTETGAETLVGSRAAGRFLLERVFRPGARVSWEELIRSATGAPLGADAFLKLTCGPA